MKVLKEDRKLVECVPRVPIPLYVLSDSTGNLARHMVTGFLTQFPAGSFQVRIMPFVGEPHRWSESCRVITARPGIVFHAVISPQLKKKIDKHSKIAGCSCCDLTGPAVEFLAKASRLRPTSDPQRLHPVDNVYCGRINAMGFTLDHDDGLGMDSLGEADIVLTGVSRTGKTPTSIYLAMLGFRVANVSLAAKVEPPRQLLELAPGKTVGLIIDPRQLAEIRGRRQTAWRMIQTDYSDPHGVQEEVEWSRRLFAKLHVLFWM